MNMSFFSKWLKKRSEKIPSCSVVIAAAGSAQRMNGEDKLFLEINGAPVLAHTLSAFQKCDHISEIVIVVRADRIEHAGRLCALFGIDKATKIMNGGASRVESVMNGVLAVSGKAQLIAIHDGARPCVDISVINRAIEAAAKHCAAAPAIKVSSTIKRASANVVVETVDRSDLFEIQTPQVFDADLIKAALTNAIENSIDVTDDCMAAELIGVPVHLTEGARTNIKITECEDIILAKALLGELICE